MCLRDIVRDMGSDYLCVTSVNFTLVDFWDIDFELCASVLGSLFIADPMKSAISPPLRAIFGMQSLDGN